MTTVPGGQGFNGGNPVAAANSTALDEEITNYVRAVAKVTVRPFNNFSISATYAPQFLDRDIDDFNTGFTYYDFSGGPPNQRIATEVYLKTPLLLLRTTSTLLPITIKILEIIVFRFWQDMSC